MDLETLRSILADNRQHVALGIVQKVEISQDKSLCRCLVQVLPDEIEVVASVIFTHANGGSGFFTLPTKNDFVLLNFASPDDIYIVGYVTSTEDKISPLALEGHSVFSSSKGKEVYIGTDTKGHLAGLDNVGDEPLVLGNVLATGLQTLLTKIEAILDQLIAGDIFLTTSPGNPTAPNPGKTATLNTLKSDIGTIKSTYITDASTNIKSQLWFTRRKKD